MPYPIHIQQQSQLQQVQMQHQHPYIHDAHQPHPHAPYGDSLQDVHHAFDSSSSPPTTNTSPAFPVHMVDHYRHSSHIPLTEQTTDLNDQYNDFSRGSSLSYLHHQDSCYISVADRGFSSTRHSPATWDGASLDVTSGMSVADNATLGYNMYRPEDLTGYASWWTLSGSTPTANGYNDTTHGQAIHESGVEMAASSITVGSVGIGLGVGGSLAVNHGEMGMAAGGLDFVSTATIASTATSGHGQLSLKPSIETDAYPPDTPVLCSPTARLPTPAAMAILLNRDRTHTPTLSQPYPPPPIRNPVSGGTPIGPGVAGITGTMSISSTQSRNIIAVTNRMNRSTDGVNGVVIPGPYSRAGEHGSQSREKKHACTMCHKRFDRPSTLRKHLLVHTGEKAFVCDTCGRRFGVASNLNRHVRRCILKPVNTAAKSLSGSPPESTASSSALSSTNEPNTYGQYGGSTDSGVRVKSDDKLSIKTEHASGTIINNSNTTAVTAGTTMGGGPARLGKASAAVQNLTPSSSSPSIAKPNKPATKRRRRAPSPSQWIPDSLLNFNLTSEDYFKTTSVPLPPVRRNLPEEERDSWDDNFTSTPYHPTGWRDVLPGPGLGFGLSGGREVRGMNLGGNGGFMLGRVLVC